MGTTAEKLTYLNTTKQDLKTVINTTGAGLTDSSTFRSYANVLNDKILGAINGEVDLFEEYPKVSGNGTDLSLNGVVEGKMSITPQGASSQESTSGKNLFNKNSSVYSHNKCDYTRNDGIYTVTPVASATNYELTFVINLPAGTYILNSDTSLSASSIMIRDASFNVLKTFSSYTNQSFTISVDATYIRFNFSTSNVSTLDLNTFMISVNGGTYEPYTGGIASPNPDYPQNVKNVTGENSLKISNENLFDGVYYNTYTGGTSPYPYASANNTRSGIIKVQPNTTYTILKGTSNRFRMSEYEEYPVVGSSYAVKYIFPSGADAFTNYTLTTGNTTKYLVIQVTNESQENVPMTVVEGTVVPTEQIPHEEQNYQLSLGNIELNSTPDGTVRDYIYGTPNNWYKREYIGKVVLNGSENWGKSANRFVSGVVSSLIKPTTSNSETAQIFSNKFIGVSINQTTQSSPVNGIAIAGSGNLVVYYNALKDYTYQEFATWLSSNNVLIYYVLATPTDIPITDTTLISQLNNIYNNAHSYNGVTNITTTYENGNEQMYLDIEALKDIEI